MARAGKLSAVEVSKAKGPAVLHDGGGLYLRVSETGAKSWVFRFQLDGKRRDMGLGPYPDISLAEARGRATEHRKQRHDGVDPLAPKVPNGERGGFPQLRVGPFARWPRNLSPARKPAGATPSIGSNGGIPSPHTCTRSWESCPSPRSTPALSYRCLTRSGQRSPRPQAGYAAASRRCSTQQRCAASGKVRTRRSGHVLPARPGAESGTPRRTALRRYARVPGRSARSTEHGGAGSGVHDPYCCTHR